MYMRNLSLLSSYTYIHIKPKFPKFVFTCMTPFNGGSREEFSSFLTLPTVTIFTYSQRPSRARLWTLLTPKIFSLVPHVISFFSVRNSSI